MIIWNEHLRCLAGFSFFDNFILVLEYSPPAVIWMRIGWLVPRPVGFSFFDNTILILERISPAVNWIFILYYFIFNIGIGICGGWLEFRSLAL